MTLSNIKNFANENNCNANDRRLCIEFVNAPLPRRFMLNGKPCYSYKNKLGGSYFMAGTYEVAEQMFNEFPAALCDVKGVAVYVD